VSTFAQLAALPGVGVTYLLEGSDDSFATIDYRYSTADGYFDHTSAYDSRIVSVGQLSREFSASGALATCTVDVVLDNTDAGADFLVDSAWAVVDSYEWRLKIALYDPSNPADYATKTLGVFGLFEPPVRTIESVTLQLCDTVSAQAEEILRSPSLSDWKGVTDSARPSYDEGSVDGEFAYDEPLPVRFGHDRHPLKRFFSENFVLSASRSTTSVPYVTNMHMRNGVDVTEAALFRWVYETTTAYDPESQMPYEITTGSYRESLPATKSATITVDGYAWTIRWLALEGLALRIAQEMRQRPSWKDGFSEDIATRLFNGGEASRKALDELGLTFRCANLGETNSDADFPRKWNAAAIAHSILADYTPLGSARVNKASFQTVAASTGMDVNGSIEASTADSDLNGQKVLAVTGSTLAPSVGALGLVGGFEIRAGTDGVLRAKALAADYHALAATPVTIDETQVTDISDRLAGRGERWEPFASVYVTKHGKTFGPYRNALSSVAGGRASRTVAMDWVGNEDLGAEEEIGFVRQDARRVADVIFGGQYASTKRPIISFTTWLEYLDLELGDFFFFSWTRGGRGTPYDNDLFRVEGIVFQPESCTMRVTAVYCADFPGLTRWPALLDNEALIVRGTGGEASGIVHHVKLVDSDATVTFEVEDIEDPGVYTAEAPPTGTAAGDILFLYDGVRARSRHLRITSVAATSVEVETGDLDFDAGALLRTTNWQVLRGKSTLPTSSEDPTNYPSGGLPYVGVADDSDSKYSSDSENGHPIGP